MNVTIKEVSTSKRLLTIVGDADDLKKIKEHVLESLQRKVSAPGFRAGKAPLSVVEKQVGPNALQTEVIEEAINHFYSETIIEQKLRTLDKPKIEVKKYVPDQTLEFTAEVETVPPVKLGDYKKLKVKRSADKVSDADIDKVIENLRLRSAKKTEVKRAAALGDEVWIDFDGQDGKGKPVAGASGKDYPLGLGSKTFIPGFEENLIGLKAGEDKTFTTTFPKDYGVAALAGSKVAFNVKLKKVNEVVLPEVDETFAKTVGPFSSVDQLRNDIRAELTGQKLREADDKAKDELVQKLVESSDVPVPEVLIKDQLEHLKQDFVNNLTYRGLTLKEYLERESLNEDQWLKKDVEPRAERRVKVGMVLSAVADAEGLQVEVAELDARIAAMRQQYQDEKARAELDKPEVQRDVASRLLTEKTLDKLMNYATK